MKAVIAIDSFKGSIDSIEAGEAAAKGIHIVYPNAKTLIYPLADGGEGTVQAMAKGLGGKLEQVEVTGPLGDRVICEYAIVENKDGKADSIEENFSNGLTAVIEMAGAAGITLVPPDQRNPLHTTTYGVGEVIKDAVSKGCRNFIIGIGGSATNDGGIGMLQALGAEFLDKCGKQVPFGVLGVEKLASINCENMLPVLKECNFRIACDVDNPLCGEKGCSRIFGPQKGATPEMVEKMDLWMERYAKLTAQYFEDRNKSTEIMKKREATDVSFAKSRYNLSEHIYNSTYPGCGAAGGLGFAFRAFLHGSLEPGINIVLEQIGIEAAIKDADIVITGEGRLDDQTVMGKAPVGVAKLAKKYDKPVLAFSGCVTEEANACNEAGIDAFFPILRQVTPLEEAMKPENAKKNMSETVEQVFRVLKLTFPS